MILKVDGEGRWAVAPGIVCGDGAGKSYDCDIAVVRIAGNEKSDEQIATEIREALENNFLFCRSLVYVRDGELIPTRHIRRFLPRVQRFVTQKSPVCYRKEFASCIADAMWATLKTWKGSD